MQAGHRAFRPYWIVPAIALGCGALMMLGAAPPAAAPATQSQSADIARQRYETAELGYRNVLEQSRAGVASFSDATEWLRRQMHARLDLQQTRAERIAGLEKDVQLFNEQEHQAQMAYRAGVAMQRDLYLAKYDRLEAELLLARARESTDK